MANDGQRERFLDALTEYLVENEVQKSISLQMGNSDAKLWAKIRNATPLFGYYPDTEDRERAKRIIAEFLGWQWRTE